MWELCIHSIIKEKDAMSYKIDQKVLISIKYWK